MVASGRRIVDTADSEVQEAAPTVALKLFLVGFFLMFAGVIVLMASALFSGDGTVSGGAIIFIGPIPIVLGVGPYSFLAIVLAAVLTVIGFIVFLWLRKKAIQA